jgi:AraC family transcriptional regulator of adaptative response/methylated-DNA-[protein]-cysteine methyltransferase
LFLGHNDFLSDFLPAEETHDLLSLFATYPDDPEKTPRILPRNPKLIKSRPAFRSKRSMKFEGKKRSAPQSTSRYFVCNEDRKAKITTERLPATFERSTFMSTHFYDVSGLAPTKSRRGKPDSDIFFAMGECSLGAILVAQSTRGVCSILIGEEPALLARDLQDQFPEANLIGYENDELVAKVAGLVEKPGAGFALPLDIRGTVFQQRVWQALQQIPPGSTATYKDVADQIGTPGAVRAVAQACAANALAVVIPCHRVVRTDGSLSGYRWGVERKRALLEREAHA